MQVLSRFYSQFLSFFVTMALTVPFVSPALAQTDSSSPSCSDHLSSTRSLRELVREFLLMHEAYEDQDINFVDLRFYKEDFYPRLKESLEANGLRVHWDSSVREGFVILPEGEHFLSRLARWLQKYEVRLKVSPGLWATRSLGSYGKGFINIDYRSLEEQRLTPTMAHELRHALNEYLSRKEEGELERRFQVTIDPFETALSRIPGYQMGAYSRWLSLDEILAFRQSVSLWLRELRKNVRDDVSTKDALFQLKGQGERLEWFSRWWLENVSILENEVKANHFVYELQEETERDGFEFLTFKITQVSNVNLEEYKKLKVSILVSAEEKKRLWFKSSVRKLILKKLSETTSEIKTLNPFIKKFNQALRSFDGEDVQSIENALKEISHQLRAPK